MQSSIAHLLRRGHEVARLATVLLGGGDQLLTVPVADHPHSHTIRFNMTSMNVSRARAALTARGIDGAALFNGAPGVYRFRLPRGAWADMAAMRERHARLLAHAG